MADTSEERKPLLTEEEQSDFGDRLGSVFRDMFIRCTNEDEVNEIGAVILSALLQCTEAVKNDLPSNGILS